jgi:hypothetical protein
MTRSIHLTLILAGLTSGLTAIARAEETLASWNDGASKRAIVAFVSEATREGGPHYVAVPERIATFDEDGTLWPEQPMYFEILFAIDRIHALAPRHPEWRTQEPFASLLRGDMKA